MNIIRIKTVAAVAIAVTGILGSSMAQARPDVRWSVSIGGPLQMYEQPFYNQPEPVYYEPAPVVYFQPRPVYVQPPQGYYGDLPPGDTGDGYTYRQEPGERG